MRPGLFLRLVLREGMSAQEPGSYHATFADAWGPQCQPLTNTVGGLGGPMA